MGDEFGSWGGPAGGGRSGREGGPFTFPHIHTRAEEEKIAWKEGPPKTKTLKFVPFPSLIILPPFDFLLFRLSPSNPPPSSSSSFSREAIKRASLLLLLCRKAARREGKSKSQTPNQRFLVIEYLKSHSGLTFISFAGTIIRFLHIFAYYGP